MNKGERRLARNPLSKRYPATHLVINKEHGGLERYGKPSYGGKARTNKSERDNELMPICRILLLGSTGCVEDESTQIVHRV
jgi:hypothetical protein